MKRGPRPKTIMPFMQLEVGECFEIHDTEATRAHNTASILSRYTDREFVSITKTPARKVLIARTK